MYQSSLSAVTGVTRHKRDRISPTEPDKNKTVPAPLTWKRGTTYHSLKYTKGGLPENLDPFFSNILRAAETVFKTITW